MDAWVSVGGGLLGAIVGGMLAMLGAIWNDRRTARTASRSVARAIFWELESNRNRAFELQTEPVIGGGSHRTAFDAGFITLARAIPDDQPLMLQFVVDAYRECEILEASIDQGYSPEITRLRAGKAAKACLHASRDLRGLDPHLPWPIGPGKEEVEIARSMTEQMETFSSVAMVAATPIETLGTRSDGPATSFPQMDGPTAGLRPPRRRSPARPVLAPTRWGRTPAPTTSARERVPEHHPGRPPLAALAGRVAGLGHVGPALQEALMRLFRSEWGLGSLSSGR